MEGDLVRSTEAEDRPACSAVLYWDTFTISTRLCLPDSVQDLPTAGHDNVGHRLPNVQHGPLTWWTLYNLNVLITQIR